ncbi:FAS1-like dehydratase domain-containing protein [Falsiroseomonas sp. E2-1-a20]|uniref:FAS1-like dehydratase domain-containing protein n=1 Tax=Falsiroseomonas sp. E2-1-a20 TaxID=3239300 RepID=UPI003F3C8771
MNDNLADWVGRWREVEDQMTAPAARRLAAMLDRAPPPLAIGASVPPHWLAILFDDAQPQSQLGPDGHPAKGDFLPPVDLPRRMLAGRRTTYSAALRIGDAVVRRSEIAAITPKQGRSGRLVFVTVRHTVTGPAGMVAVEEQDIAYREAASGSPDAAPPADPLPEAAWREPFQPDTVLLFRYSALTFNGHRIHYDADYARDEEGYPGLVVNGGLTTMMLLEAALRHADPDATIRATDTRTLRPLTVGRPAFLAGTAPDEEGRQWLWAEDEAGRMALRIQARIG